MIYMIIKYPRIYRIPLDNTSFKKTLTIEEAKELLDGTIILEEKIDGGIIGLTNKHAQGRGSEIRLGETGKAFKYFNSWRTQNQFKIDKIPDNFIIYGEWMYAKHNICYDSLTDFFIAFDVYDIENKKFLGYDEKAKVINNCGFEMVPLLFIGEIKNAKDILEFIKISHFSSTETMEGIVIKNYPKQLFGKYVRREFTDDLDEYWLKKPLQVNKLVSWQK